MWYNRFDCQESRYCRMYIGSSITSHIYHNFLSLDPLYGYGRSDVRFICFLWGIWNVYNAMHISHTPKNYGEIGLTLGYNGLPIKWRTPTIISTFSLGNKLCIQQYFPWIRHIRHELFFRCENIGFFADPGENRFRIRPFFEELWWRAIATAGT